jgi:hypothetical protein
VQRIIADTPTFADAPKVRQAIIDKHLNKWNKQKIGVDESGRPEVERNDKKQVVLTRSDKGWVDSNGEIVDGDELFINHEKYSTPTKVEDATPVMGEPGKKPPEEGAAPVVSSNKPKKPISPEDQKALDYSKSMRDKEAVGVDKKETSGSENENPDIFTGDEKFKDAKKKGAKKENECLKNNGKLGNLP